MPSSCQAGESVGHLVRFVGHIDSHRPGLPYSPPGYRQRGPPAGFREKPEWTARHPATSGRWVSILVLVDLHLRALRTATTVPIWTITALQHRDPIHDCQRVADVSRGPNHRAAPQFCTSCEEIARINIYTCCRNYRDKKQRSAISRQQSAKNKKGDLLTPEHPENL